MSDAELQRAIFASLKPGAPPQTSRAPARGTLAREGITSAHSGRSRPSRPTRTAPRRSSVDGSARTPPRVPAQQKDKDEETFTDGCLRLPARFSRAASKAGLGNEHGVYGHLGFAKGVSDAAPVEGGGAAPVGGGEGGGEGEGGGGVDSRPAYAGDDRLFVSMIERDIVHGGLGVSFDDIAALDTAKRLLNEAVVLPLVMPEFFTGIIEPWRGVLLFGPPGTGKTMLAKAVASMNGTTFFNCSAASLVHKYRGDSEKVVRCLFNMARHHSPSIIFIDEIDAVMSSRTTSEGDDGSRRLKTEILSQMDGLESTGRGIVMVMATSNRPWDLDEALRRRLEKRIYVTLPEHAARRQMLEFNMRDVPVEPTVSYEEVAAATEGFSGADMRLLCREAAMAGIRRLLDDRTPQEVQAMRAAGQLEAPPVEERDFIAALESTRPSVAASELSRYEAWEQEFGSR